jgi:hypothetical protein
MSTGDVEMFGNQVAGHKKEGKSILKQGDKLFKPFSVREFEFYEYMKTWDNQPRFFPKYFGRVQISGEADTVNRILPFPSLSLSLNSLSFFTPTLCTLSLCSRQRVQMFII